MTDNILEFAAVKRRTFIADEGESPRRRTRRPNMQTLVFRSLKLIVESDAIDLTRDVRFDIERAVTKLARIRQRLRSVQEQAAAQVRQLKAAETKLSEAIEAAQATPADDKSDAYRDLLEAFGKLDHAGQKSIVSYLHSQV